MIEYVIKALTALFLGFFPYFEIYLAVPAAVIMGLDPFSVIFWTVLGNYLAVPTIFLFFKQITKIRFIKRWFEKQEESKRNSKFHKYLEKSGVIALLFLTPWIGIWFATLAAKTAGMTRRNIYLFTFISIFSYAVVILVLMKMGFNMVPEYLPDWLPK